MRVVPRKFRLSSLFTKETRAFFVARITRPVTGFDETQEDTALKRIKIFDTTLRDGEQSPGCSMNLSEKIEMAKQLEALGVDVIEAGFAIASPMDLSLIHI